MAGEDPLDVAIHDGAAFAVGKGGNRRGGGRADPRQGGDGGRGVRKAPAPVRDDLLRTGVQIAGAGVIAEARPQGHDLFRWRGGQGRHGGESSQEFLVIRDDRGYLGLLQHDFGQPDPVRVLGVLPRQLVTAVLALPRNNAVEKITHGVQR